MPPPRTEIAAAKPPLERGDLDTRRLTEHVPLHRHQHDGVAAELDADALADPEQAALVLGGKLDPHRERAADVDLIELTGALEDAERDDSRQPGAARHGRVGHRQDLRAQDEQPPAAATVLARARYRHAVTALRLYHDAEVADLHDADWQEVGGAERLGHRARSRVLIDVRRIAELLD